MQLNIPSQFDAMIRQRAAAAGFEDVQSFAIQRLLTEDTDSELEQILRNNEERIEDLITEALASGPATPLTKADFEAAQQRLTERLRNAQSNGPS